MRRNYKRALALLCLLGWLGWAGPALAQDNQDLFDRILNPLPEFDPFDKPLAAPQYFPDDVDKRARGAMIDALTQKNENLADGLKFFTERDAQLKKERGATTGLTDQVRDLYNNTIEDRERYLEAQNKALSFVSSPQHKQLIESRIKNDDLNQAHDQLKKSATNKWGGMLNRMLSAMDLANIVTGNYTGAAVDSAVQQIVAMSSSDMPIEERRALALLNEHLKRYPDDPKNPEIRKQIDALEKRKRRALAQKQLDKAEEALKKKNLTQAEFYYQVAAAIDPLSRAAEAGLDQVKQRAQAEEQERKKALAVAAPPRQGVNAAEQRDMNELLYALTLRDQEKIQSEAAALEKKYRGTATAASARDAAAVGLEIKGRHEEAKKLLQQVADASNAPHERQRAQALLQNPEYNLLDSFERARTQHTLDTVKFVLLGDDFLKKNLLLAAGPLVTAGPAGAVSVAAANVMIVGTNLLQVLTNNPISYQNVIDKGVDYIRNHPESATDVYEVLAGVYEDTGMYDKAIAYYEMSGKAPEKKLADLKEKAAKDLLQAASKSTERSSQEYYLKQILDNYADSSAAKEANQRLARMTKLENQGLRMTKKFLMENPELYGAQGLGLKPSLFDGNLSNMELADKGVSVIGDNEVLVNFQTPWGVRTQVYRINDETNDRFQMAVRQRNYDLALASVDTRPKGTEGGIKNVPRTLLAGTLAKKPSTPDTGESTFTFMREFGSSSTAINPRGLDAQFQTEAERDPTTRYKLPPLQGNISATHFDISGGLPAGLWGDKLMLGTDQGSPFAGVQVPIPLLQGFIPVDFMVQGRPGRFSLFPKIRLSQDKGNDQELYR
ncbi:MAG TPA: hypothetical protein VGL11_16270 [Candidatus Binatia bacterium]